MLMLCDLPAPSPLQRPIVITATRTEYSPVGAVSAVEEDEIERLQPGSLLEVLDDIAGVRAFSTGGPGGRSFLSIRGGEPNFTLVLVDGMKLNDPTNSRGGGFDFFAIEPSLVDRVEVSRGAVSAVHGSDALSGAVNIGLRPPGHYGPSARIQAGSEGDFGLGAGFGLGGDDGGASVAGSWYDSGGLGEESRLERRQALANLGYRLRPFHAQLVAIYGRADRSAFPEDSGGPRLAVNREREQGRADLRAIGLTLRTYSPSIRPHLSLSWSEQRDRNDTPAIAPGLLQGTPALTADSRFTRLEAIAEVSATRGPFIAALGAAWLREFGRSDGTIDLGFPLPVSFDLDRTTRSAFAEASLRPGGGFTLNLAGRYDHVAGGDGRFTARAGLSWKPSAGGPAFFARAGEGYKLPSFFALAHPLIGNPALRPERSRNLEAGIELKRGSLEFLRLTVFSNRYKDLIDFDPETFQTVNRIGVGADGAELEGRWDPTGSLRLSGALSWLDLKSPIPLRGRPRWQGSLRAAWDASDALELNAAIRFNSDYFDSSIPTGLVRAAGHEEVDLGLRYRLSDRFSLAVALRNLADSRHEDAVGFPGTGRLVRATIGADF
jgi:outer membrane receptor protein involved in Fe transport